MAYKPTIDPELAWLGIVLLNHWPHHTVPNTVLNDAGHKINATITRSNGVLTREHVVQVLAEHRLTPDGDRTSPKMSKVLELVADKLRAINAGLRQRYEQEGRPMLNPVKEAEGERCLMLVRELDADTREDLRRRAIAISARPMQGWLNRLDLLAGDLNPNSAALARGLATLMADLHDGGSRVRDQAGNRLASKETRDAHTNEATR